MPTVSVIIPTLGRSNSLFDCKESLYKQSYQDWELILVKEEGSLSALRNEGARRAKGSILVFTDDDIVAEPFWLEGIVNAFSKGVVGVSGPSYTTEEYRKNRDCFVFPTWLFSHSKPGHLSSWGQWSLAATKEDCDYDGPVNYLEACNMAFQTKAFRSVDGFDERYTGIGDWSEPDLCYRLRAKGHRLWFARDARLEHRPSQSGAYKKRLKPSQRMENYELFSKRWIQPSIQRSLYKAMMRAYFKWRQR